MDGDGINVLAYVKGTDASGQAGNPPESPDWATWRKKRSRADHEVTYQIEWLVPAEHAIGGKAHWMPLRLPHGQTWTALKVVAMRWFRRATAAPRRLVAVERRMLEEVES